MVGKYKSRNILTLFLNGTVAVDALPYRVPLFPNIFTASVVMMAFSAFYTIVFNMGKVSECDRGVMNLPSITLV